MHIQFYFPRPGTFEHLRTHVSESLIVCAKSEVKKLQVRKTRLIKKVETFKDMMMMNHTLEDKQRAIIDLLSTKEDLLTDQKFGFKIE